jgi:hypothetical protein
MKFFALVLACGLYQGHDRICLEWSDTRWHASREQCLKRGGEIAAQVKTLARWSGLALERSPQLRCLEK